MIDKWTVVKALEESTLPSSAKLVALLLVNAADGSTTTVRKFAPSITTLAQRASLARSTTVTTLDLLEAHGWVVRHRPSVTDARENHTTTWYTLRIGSSPEKSTKAKKASPATGPASPKVVRSSDQPASPVTEPAQQGASPTIGPDLVRPSDQASPVIGQSWSDHRTHTPNPQAPTTPMLPETGQQHTDDDSPGLFDPPPSSLKPETENQRIGRLTKTYTDRVKLSNFMGVRGIVAKAVEDGYNDADITAALDRLREERTQVTAGTLAYVLNRRPQIKQVTPPVSSNFDDWKPHVA